MVTTWKVTIWDEQTRCTWYPSFCKTFADVAPQREMCYVNSLLNFSVAINLGNFANTYMLDPGHSGGLK
jgi:S-adenosylmethionine hydrolase